MPGDNLPPDDLAPWEFDHRFESGHEAHGERQTRVVMGLTFVMMVAEIVAGTVFQSMALLADGWHMATHAGALGIAVLAYTVARRHANNPRFTFGTGKIGALAAFTSAVLLGVVAALIIWESASRLADPPSIAFNEAIAVAVLGLLVNAASAWMLGRTAPGHGHGASHAHADTHPYSHARDQEPPPPGHHLRHDHNLRAAYFHVLADALTSVLAIVALLLGAYLGWWWMDLAAGALGAIVIGYWAAGLLRESGAVLLDWSGDPALEHAVRAAIEGEPGHRVTDLHVWKVGPARHAAILSILADTPRDPGYYKERLGHLHELAHVTIEVHARLAPGLPS
ncbi:MAG: CDF family Co(II)/Ni(II) efflux transporter DmeF [Alphaproteobacteria bacterium]